MTKVRLLALLAVVALVLFPAIAFAQVAAPQMPCAFHGTVQVSGANVADGIVITATIGNETYTTTTSDSIYRVVIAPPAGKAYEGLPVNFKIGSDTAKEIGTWQLGGNVALNLTKGTPPITSGGSVINGVQLGNTTGYNPTTGIITIKQSDITGAKGDIGATGPTGPEGPTGKSANNVIGIIAIVIAIIAVAIAGIVMMRKPQKV
ncbi:MAG: hypothetical protein NTV59_07900 [Chloroflexi bacterium]|nr:hypothetical protein [Chloroflexota bacterium]